MKNNRDVIGIYLTGLLFMMGNMLPNPIIAGYSLSLGASSIMMSIIVGLNSIIAMICRPFVGRLSDTINRYHLAMFGLGTMLTGAVLLTFAWSPWVLAIGRIVNGIGFTCSSVCFPAWLATLLPKDKLGKGISIYGTIAALAMAIGPGTGVIIYQTFGYRFAYAVILIMQGLAVLLVQTVKSNREIDKKQAKELPKTVSDTEQKKPVINIGNYIYFKVVPICTIGLLLCIPYFSTQTYLVQFTEIKSLNIAVSIFFPMYAIILAIIRTMVSKAIDRFPFKAFFWLGVTSMTIFMILLNYMTNNIIMVLVAFFLATGYGMINTVIQSESVVIAGPGNEGVANGTFYLALDIGVTIGTMAGGIVFTHVPIDMFFPCQLIVVPLCIVIYFKYIKGKTSK